MSNRADPTFIIRSQDYNKASIAACLGILYYDYTLTLGSEVRLYWGKEKWSWTRSFFFLNRYTALIAHIPIALEFFLPGLSEKSCHNLQWFHQLYCVAATFLVTVLLVIRTYALYERNRCILALLCTIVVCGAVVGCWAIVRSQSYPDIPRGNTGVCALPLTAEQGKLFAIAWSPAMLFDTIVFSLTFYKRLQMGRTPENNLLYLMIRDGTMYFGFLVVLYSMDLVNFLVFGDIVQLATLTNVVASTLISRLMLNIRDTKRSGELTLTANFTTLVFAERDARMSHV